MRLEVTALVTMKFSTYKEPAREVGDSVLLLLSSPPDWVRRTLPAALKNNSWLLEGICFVGRSVGRVLLHRWLFFQNETRQYIGAFGPDS
jgi:hypothetical protein